MYIPIYTIVAACNINCLLRILKRQECVWDSSKDTSTWERTQSIPNFLPPTKRWQRKWKFWGAIVVGGILKKEDYQIGSNQEAIGPNYSSA